MRMLRVLASSACLLASLATFVEGTSIWRFVFLALSTVGGVAAVVVMRRDREEQRLDEPPSIL